MVKGGRGGRCVRRQREKKIGKCVGLRIETLNVGTRIGNNREVADMMERRKVDILCLQKTWWKISDTEGVFEESPGFEKNRVMSVEIEGVMLNVVSV